MTSSPISELTMNNATSIRKFGTLLAISASLAATIAPFPANARPTFDAPVYRQRFPTGVLLNPCGSSYAKKPRVICGSIAYNSTTTVKDTVECSSVLVEIFRNDPSANPRALGSDEKLIRSLSAAGTNLKSGCSYSVALSATDIDPSRSVTVKMTVNQGAQNSEGGYYGANNVDIADTAALLQQFKRVDFKVNSYPFIR
jgi:hypothetical protein